MGPDAAQWNDRLEREHDNLRAALTWIVENDQGELGLRMIIALWRFWQVRGHLIEAADRIERVLAMPSVSSQPPELRARAYSAAGGIAYWRSNAQDTYRYYHEALGLARSGDDRALLAAALYDAGFAPVPGETTQGERMRLGQPMWEEALAIFRDLGDEAGVASSLWALSMSAAANEDIDRGMAYAIESLEMSRRRGDRFRTGWAAHMVGLATLTKGDPDTAARYLGESLELWVEAGDRSGITLLVYDLAQVSKARGTTERRWHLLGAADQLRVLTGVDLVNEQVDFLGWDKAYEDPRDEDEQRWFDEGKRLSLDEAIELAREEVRGD